LRPENRLYIWPTHRIMNLRPENQAYLWPSPAQSMRSDLFGVACKLFYIQCFTQSACCQKAARTIDN